MKKVLFLILICILAGNAWSEPADMVILLDTSESMFGEFDSKVTYLVDDIINKFIRIGDSFHLLVFDSNTRTEFTREIKTADDAAAVIRHLDLIHPFGKYTDLIEAYETVYNYVLNLPESSVKNIVILTDGIHDPPPGKYDINEIEKRKELLKQLEKTGWNITIVPLDGSQKSQGEFDEDGNYINGSSGGQEDAIEELSQDLDAEVVDPNSEIGQLLMTGAVKLTIRKSKFKSFNQKLKITFTAESFNKKDLEIIVTDVLYNNKDLLSAPAVFKISSRDKKKITLELDFYGLLTETQTNYPIVLRVKSQNPVSPLNYTLSVDFGLLTIQSFLVPIIIAGVLLLVLIIFLIYRAVRYRDKSEKNKGYSVGKRSEDRGPGRKKGISLSSVGNAKHISPYASASPKNGDRSKSSHSLKGSNSVDNILGLKKGHEKIAESKEKTPKESNIQYEKGQSIEIPSFPKLQFHSFNRNVKFLLMLNVNSEFDPLNASRHVQRLEKHTDLTLGSGNSSFYLYFNKMLPGAIAKIRFNGTRCSFIPEDFKYFPGLKAPLEDCINRKITIVHGDEEQTITFKEWLSPLEEINRIMALVDYRGLPRSPWKDK